MREWSEDTIENFLERFRTAWNAGDAGAFAALFTEDATYITWFGDLLAGRQEIAAAHEALFLRRRTQMRVKAVNVLTFGADLHVVSTVGGSGGEGSTPYDKFQTFVLTRVESTWFCAAFQNTAMSEGAKAALN